MYNLDHARSARIKREERLAKRKQGTIANPLDPLLLKLAQNYTDQVRAYASARYSGDCVCACARACLRACVRACVRAFVRMYVRACKVVFLYAKEPARSIAWLHCISVSLAPSSARLTQHLNKEAL